MLSFFALVYSNDLGYFFLHAFGRGVFLCWFFSSDFMAIYVKSRYYNVNERRFGVVCFRLEITLQKDLK